MKYRLRNLSILALGLTASLQAFASSNLIYVPVDPCRIVDTRGNATAYAGAPIPADNVNVDGDARAFLVSGDSDALRAQGGSPSGCLHPKWEEGLEPAAIAAYIIAKAEGTAGGVTTVFPADLSDPPVGSGSTVNLIPGSYVGNTTIVTLCKPESCPADGQFAILARGAPQHALVDVQGYFYPKEKHNVLAVSPAGADYASPVDAIAYLQALLDDDDDAFGNAKDPSPENPYLISLGPGVYNLGLDSLQLLPGVTVKGAGVDATKLLGSGGTMEQALVIGSDDASLRNLTVHKSGGPNATAMYNPGVAPVVDHVKLLADGASGTGIGVYNTDGATPSVNSVVIGVTGNGVNTGVRNDNTAAPVFVDVAVNADNAVVNTNDSNVSIYHSNLTGGLENDSTSALWFSTGMLDGDATGDGFTCVYAVDGMLNPLSSNCLPTM